MNSFKLIKYHKKYGYLAFYLKVFKDYFFSNKSISNKEINDANWYFDLASSRLSLSSSYRVVERKKNKRKITKVSEKQISEDIYPLI